LLAAPSLRLPTIRAASDRFWVELEETRPQLARHAGCSS